MKKMILAAVATVAIVASVAPSFADGSGIQQQSANIQAGGAAYPAGVVQYLQHK